MTNLRLRASAAGLLLAAALGHATEPGDATAAVDVAALKSGYLACDRAASQRRLDFGEAAECSRVSERLLRHGFGGDFERLLVWWRAAKHADSEAPADAPVELARR